MTLYVVVWHYVDDTELLDRVRPLHREYVTKLVDAGTVRQAGPWLDSSGGMLIYDVADQEELNRWIAEDPYSVNGVIADWRSWAWRPLMGALSDG